MLVDPQKLLYSETHEWTALEDQNGHKVATVGITAFAVEQLTDIVFLELPKVGSQLKSGAEFGEVESVKAVSPLYSPVDGEVVEVNAGLPDALEQLSQDPFGAGWIMKVRVGDESSLSRLMDYAAYQKQCAEGH